MLGRESIPWVLLTLLNTQRNTATLLINIKHHHFYFVTELNDLRGVYVLVGPVHFRHVNQSFDALFNLSKATVVREVCNTRIHTAALWITICNLHPRIFAQLLKTQRYAVAFAIKLKNLHIKLLSHFNHFAWVLDSLPCHVSDVQQPIDAAEINKRTVVSEVLDHTLDALTFL